MDGVGKKMRAYDWGEPAILGFETEPWGKPGEDAALVKKTEHLHQKAGPQSWQLKREVGILPSRKVRPKSKERCNAERWLGSTTTFRKDCKN